MALNSTGNKFQRGVIICLLLVISGCSKLLPAGFWRTYHQKEIVFKDTDQGPWGGYSTVEWRLQEPINRANVLLFAKRNGWQLVDSVDLVGAWGEGHNQVISFKDTAIDELFSGYLASQQFLGRVKQPSVIYIFSTGWMKVLNSTKTENNGFLLISKDNRQLVEYHEWGE